MVSRIRTVVIPAGTRPLLTRAVPTELLSVWKRRRFDCGNFAGLLQANIAVPQLDEPPVAAPRPAKQPAEASAA